MGIVFKIEMVAILKCTSMLKDMGMSPLLLCMSPNMAMLPLQAGSSEQTTNSYTCISIPYETSVQ